MRRTVDPFSLDRLRSDGRFAWLAAGFAALVMCGACLWAGLTWRLARADARALQQQHAALEQGPSRFLALDAESTPRANEPLVTHPHDFTSSLSDTPSTTEVVQSLHRASAEALTTLVSLQLQARPATPQQLARAELSVTLRGPYLSVRQVLDDVLGRCEHVGVSRLRVRRAPASTVAAVGSNPAAASEVEASAVLSIWARPQAAAPTAQPAAPGR